MGNKEIAIVGGRQSNIEALRLLSMLMVLNLHSFWGYNHGSGIGQIFDFFRESSSICAVNVFLLISGYFGIRWKLKSFYNLIFQLFFYAFGVYLTACAIGAINFSLKGFLSNVVCVYNHWGFIKYYVLLYFFAPILNAFIEKVSNKQLLIFIIILLLCENFIIRGHGFTNYCLMYFIGRWINRTGAVKHLDFNPRLYYWIITFLITMFVYLFYLYTPINTAERMCGFIMGYDYAAPLVISQAICLFFIFARMEFTSRLVNWCASSCLAVFLIHMHPRISWIGYYAITEAFYDLPIWRHCIYLLLLIMGVFCGSILIDKIRIVVSDYVYLKLKKIISIIPEKFLLADTYIPETIKKIL